MKQIKDRTSVSQIISETLVFGCFFYVVSDCRTETHATCLVRQHAHITASSGISSGCKEPQNLRTNEPNQMYSVFSGQRSVLLFIVSSTGIEWKMNFCLFLFNLPVADTLFKIWTLCVCMCVCVLPGHCTSAHCHNEAAANNHPSPSSIQVWVSCSTLFPISHRSWTPMQFSWSQSWSWSLSWCWSC